MYVHIQTTSTSVKYRCSKDVHAQMTRTTSDGYSKGYSRYTFFQTFFLRSRFSFKRKRSGSILALQDVLDVVAWSRERSGLRRGGDSATAVWEIKEKWRCTAGNDNGKTIVDSNVVAELNCPSLWRMYVRYIRCTYVEPVRVRRRKYRHRFRFLRAILRANLRESRDSLFELFTKFLLFTSEISSAKFQRGYRNI